MPSASALTTAMTVASTAGPICTSWARRKTGSRPLIFTSCLPVTMVLGPAPWPRTSALGDSTRRYSAASSKRAPLSKATVSLSCAGLRRSSVGHGASPLLLSAAIALFVRQRAGLVGQHYRHAAANGIGKPCGPRDKLLPLTVIMQPGLGQRADKDFQQFGVGFHILLVRLRRPLLTLRQAQC